jgi:hypothetical protein
MTESELNEQTRIRLELRRLRAVASLAFCIVVQTPKPAVWATKCLVSRGLMQEIEEALVEAGHDMRKARKAYRRAVKS